MRYPLFLDLVGQKVVVIGAGQVAERKVRLLLAAEADITVISPQATAPIRKLARLKRVRWLRRRYRIGDLRTARLAIAATNDGTLNERICTDAKRRRLLVNCVAPPEAGNFIVPALVRCGNLTVAISTGGASPALARRIRRELEQYLHDGYAQAAVKMAAIRKAVSKDVKSAAKRRAIYRRSLKTWLKKAN
ncbi:MAG: bifunctional precorrin-2 dehydrogenase/sirohydrochlorin ferrochelatase [Verrucomicrobiia bacterium]|jgi:precorrin-2 dehydrogenase/sirohydrochlorin ferrochelatase